MNISKKIRTFFLSTDVWVFLLFFVISFLFWFVHTADRKRVTHFSLPVSYTGLSDNYAITSDLPGSVDVTIRDEGKNIFVFFREKPEGIAIDLSAGLNGESGNITIDNSRLAELIAQQVPPTAEIRDYKPQQISVGYSRLRQKQLQVQNNCQVQLARQYQLVGEPELVPSEVTAYGSRQALAAVELAETEAAKLSNLTDSASLKVRLKPIEGVKLVPQEVTLTCRAVKFTEKTLTATITPVHLPDSVSVRLFPAEVTVTCNVSLNDFAALSGDDFRVVFDYSRRREQKNGKVRLTATCTIPSVSNIRLSPSEADYITVK